LSVGLAELVHSGEVHWGFSPERQIFPVCVTASIGRLVA